jgi:dTDP-glucose pyrophosphorylase
MYDATVFDKIKHAGAFESRRTGNHRRQQRLHPGRRHDVRFLDGWWTDAGTFESLLRAANLVAQSVTARRQAEAEKLTAEGASDDGGRGRSSRSLIASSGSLELAIPECEKASAR